MSDDRKLTTQSEDFAAWYNEVVLRAELAGKREVLGQPVLIILGQRLIRGHGDGRPWGIE